MRKEHQFGDPGFRHVMLCDPANGIDDYGYVRCDACGQSVLPEYVVRMKNGNRLCRECAKTVNKLKEGKI